ncbi:hypothetical protein A4X13_0g1160 [Tilletia indica]|uniref:Uncharacterized protein n=1 Tax=Tilletia indica TaxID=43049 RepID=A0A177TNI8_9BASI|nr:hypothetical protein A4X13_0g1160 [Tilletia indica]
MDTSHSNTMPPSTEDINTLINTIHQHTPTPLNITLTQPTSIDHSLNNITRILKPIADQLRSDNNHSLRHSLGSSTQFTTAAVQLILSTLSLPHTPTTTAEAQLHILRLFANLCIDSPTNRTALLNVHAPQAIITFLSSLLALSSSSTTPFYPADILPLLRTAVGALLNMQLAHNPTRATLRAYPPTIPILAHLSYSPAIYSLNAVSALLSPTPPSDDLLLQGGSFALALAGFVDGGDDDQDGQDALEELQVRASIASWANQVLMDVCSDRPNQPSPSSEESSPQVQTDGLPNGNSTVSDSTVDDDSTPAEKEGDEDDDEENDDEPEGEINAEVVASLLPLSSLILPLSAFLSHPSTSLIGDRKPFPQALARALSSDEDARLSLVSTDIELLQNAVQLLEKAVLEVREEVVDDEPSLGDVSAVAPPDAAGVEGSQQNGRAVDSIRKKMLDRDQLCRAPWPNSAEAPVLSQWLDLLSSSHLEKTITTTDDEDEDASSTPTRFGPSSPSSSSTCALAVLMHFLERGHAPLLAAAAQRSASSTTSTSSSSAAAPSVSDLALTNGTSAGALLRAAAQSFARCKTGLARVLVEVLGDDDCMEALFEPSSSSGNGGGWFVETLKRWMKADRVVLASGVGVGREDELQSTALLAMGNLARKDSHCIALVKQHNLAPFLVSLLPDPTSALPTATDTASTSTPVPAPAAAPTAAQRRLSHSVLSLLKNLSIPSTNKALIGSLGVISRISSAGFLDTKGNITQVQFAAVGLLKHLCRGEVGCAVEVVLGSGTGGGGKALEKLLGLIEESEDVPVRMEGTRVLVYVIKALWASSPPTTSIDPETIQRARKILTTAFPSSSTDEQDRAHAVRLALARMIRSAGKYPVLVNEGVVALTLLASESEGSAEGVAEALVSEGSENSGSSYASGVGVAPSLGGAGGSGSAAGAGGVGGTTVLGQQEQGPGGVIMAEPESFVPAGSTSTAAVPTPAPAPVGSTTAPRAGPVSNLLRTETAGGGLANPVHHQGSGGSSDSLGPGPGQRRQSTAEAYVQAGLAPSPHPTSASASASHARSPLASGSMDVMPAVPAQQQQQRTNTTTTPLRATPSASTLLTAPRPSALSMLDVVLGRRDARMPPHFASNAAVLVQVVVSRSSSSSAGGGVVARRTEEALERLEREGPEEAQGAARDALGVLRIRLGVV